MLLNSSTSKDNNGYCGHYNHWRYIREGNLDCEDVNYSQRITSVKYELDAVYDSLGLSFANNGIAIFNPAYSSTFTGNNKTPLYTIKVNGKIPEGDVVYVKRTVTFNGDVKQNEHDNLQPHISYIPLAGENNGQGPEQPIIDVALDENLQDVILANEGAILQLKAGTYTGNFSVPLGITIRGANDGETIIKAANATKPVFTTQSRMLPAKFENLTIDGQVEGGDKASNGITENGSGEYFIMCLENVTIKNCTTGLRVSNQGQVKGCTITENEIGVLYDQPIGMSWLGNNTINKNDVGIKFSDGYKQSIYRNGEVRQQNNISENTIDVKNDCTGVNPNMQNNYFGANGPVSGKVIGSVKVHPYYMDAIMCKVTADVSKLDVVDGKKELPFTITEEEAINNTKSPTIDKQVFSDIMTPQAKRSEDKSAVVNGYCKVNGKDVTAYKFSIDSVTKPVDFNTRFDSNLDTTSQSAMNKANIDNGNNRPISFKHDGDLPGQTVVTLVDTSGKYKPGDVLYIYLINPATQKLEKSGTVTVTEIDKIIYLTFTMDHCSDYVISNVEVKNDNTNGGNNGNSNNNSNNNTSGGSYTLPTVEDVVDSGDVNDAISNAEDNVATIDISNKPIMSIESFEELGKKPNTTLALKGDGYSWSFKGKDIDTTKLSDIAFNTQISSISPNAKTIKALTDNAVIQNVYFSYHGQLPGKATVKTQTNFKNQIVRLYYFNSAKNQLEYVCDSTVDENGVATFDIDHCSDYVLSETVIATAVGNPKAPIIVKHTTAPNPKTGDNTLPIMPIILISIIAMGVLTLEKKVMCEKK